jgi:hypothetical protein
MMGSGADIQQNIFLSFSYASTRNVLEGVEYLI